MSKATSDAENGSARLYEALRTQIDVLHLWEEAGETLGGWKVGMTSGTSRDKMGVGFRPFGYILQSRILNSGSDLSRARIQVCQVEPEICLTIGSELGGSDLTLDDARRAVSEVSPAFEINELRRVGTETPWQISIVEDLSNWGIAVGNGIPVNGADLTQTEVTVTHDDVVMSSVVPGATMDDPYLSLLRLCKNLGKYGISLVPGQKIITGAFSHHRVPIGGVWKASFGGIGTVELTFV